LGACPSEPIAVVTSYQAAGHPIEPFVAALSQPPRVDAAPALRYFLSMKSIPAGALAVLLTVVPANTWAHSAGDLDRHGCHPDKRHGTYHCHRGRYNGIEFPSKADMLRNREAGATQAQARQDADSKLDKRESLFGPLLGEKTTDQRAAGGGEVVVPQGVERRLEVLEDLHDKGLISDDEYERKRKEILGQL
jgi:hypothetical protein